MKAGQLMNQARVLSSVLHAFFPTLYQSQHFENPIQSCTSDTKPQCAHLNILANEKNWKVQDCYAKEAFACQVKVGQKIHQGLFHHYD